MIQEFLQDIFRHFNGVFLLFFFLIILIKFY